MAGRVVLVGAGHAHMEALRQAERFQKAGLTLTLIDPGAFWYSGAATAMLSGALPQTAARADPAAITPPFKFIRSKVSRIDCDSCTVETEDGRTCQYDALSLNTGSRIAPSALTRSGAVPVKPVSGLADVRARIEKAHGALRLAVAGSGATGVEVALSLAALQRRLGADVDVLLAGPDTLLPGWPDKAGELARDALDEARVRRIDQRAEQIREGRLIDADGGAHCVDLVIAATGLSASLPDGLGPGGAGSGDGLRVGEDMAWLEDGRIFAAGDCAHMTHAPRPKLGVFGVRAAPVLIDNLIAAATGKTRRRAYHPQTRWLSIMDLGDGTGLGRYGGFAHRSRAALAIKRHIDAGFVRRYQP